MTNTFTVDEQPVPADNSNNTGADSVITLTDLQNVLVVIDLASTRGAFRGPELQPIGQLWEKIDRFVKAAAPPAEEPSADTATAQELN